MMLTRLQLKVLRNTALLHETPPTFGGLLKATVFSRCYLLYAIGFLYSAYLCWSGPSEAGFVGVGIFCGYAIKDLATIRFSVKLWPLNLEIIDWKKVEELLKASKKETGGPDSTATPSGDH